MGIVRWLFDAQLVIGDQTVLWREVIGNVFGLLSALGGMRRKVWAWPVGIAGNALLFHARQLMSQVDTMRAELSDYTRQGKGLVRMQANASALAQYLPEDLAAFAATHPEVPLRVFDAAERGGQIILSASTISWQRAQPIADDTIDLGPDR